ncbi:sirohydrochlorin chelatase [Arthrobacter sp. VKM Ac-2550]|uniref:sirohydrochlorin chelatase n=1 Tax=Crystallibacter permensis TaxID=1938888 RepID=UPI002227989E|nr:CbiX/SirB N-terminal domain-containing protein [Arthrobacter sp. VKM Ac-2550]MCW2131430.1 Sirohydrochlorin ferrochelatase [Arthrobacter sp. VKM Ac-2550]
MTAAGVLSNLDCEPWGGLVDVHAASSLVAASHGTSSLAGQSAIGNLVRAVARRRPDLNVAEAFVDVQQPDVSTVLGGLAEDARIVPLLLSAGYHVHVDLAEAAACHESASVTRALGPDPRLVKVLARRLQESGLRRGDRVILGAAGSTDARAVADCETTARMLGKYLGMKVATGYISAAQPELKSAVAVERARIAKRRFAGRNARVVVAAYLLAPGYFASLAASCGADIVTEPLLVPDQEPPAELVNLVLERFTRG